MAKGVATVGTVRVVFEEGRVATYNTISFLMFTNPFHEGVRREDEGILVEESRKVGQRAGSTWHV